MTEKPAARVEAATTPKSGWRAGPRVRVRKTSRGARKLVTVGGRRGGLTDLYHGLLGIPLWGLLLVLAAVYVGLNVIFAGV